ncbi:unnamed protein product [Oncorhynchus mykiss]|uniref:Uncharacterized protein n=1 Tax=Oncorhynchus mykiss TaxID=8022 RepID=A0A060WBE1_ONCMY|nr:unnamed protein product [Oncorhynchus mykiss]
MVLLGQDSSPSLFSLVLDRHTHSISTCLHLYSFSYSTFSSSSFQFCCLSPLAILSSYSFSFPPFLHPSSHPSLHRPDGQPTLLPPVQVQELNVLSTGMLNSVQRLFSHHMIETFGCDYSTSGVTLEALQAKLKAFLELRTADGPRHDTYVVFYSGHTQRTGAWALAGGDSLRLEQLLEWWKEKNSGFTSRLILVLDTENSMPWVKEVRRMEGVYVAVQGAELAPAGDITSEWVEFNCNPDSATQWSEKGRTVAAAYETLERLHAPSSHGERRGQALEDPLPPGYLSSGAPIQLVLWAQPPLAVWSVSEVLQATQTGLVPSQYTGHGTGHQTGPLID